MRAGDIKVSIEQITHGPKVDIRQRGEETISRKDGSHIPRIRGR
jgi:hypothetical protein